MIYLLRHGETLWNRQGRLQGQQDSPLTARGVAQARANGRRLRQGIGDPAAWSIVSSPLGRCWQTAVLVAESLGLDPDSIRFDARLMEIGYGVWEGLTFEEIRARYPTLWRARQEDRWHFSVPGGESYAALAARATAWLADCDPAARLIAISHGGTGRVLRGHCGALPAAETVALTSDHGAIHLLTAERTLGRGLP
ncbi:MAG TPA: histidine phosphatase family protein [Kiloniellaceae bacterium]|nr:histidine phosphatase family protein [Kiloniellaceae bacterium]